MQIYEKKKLQNKSKKELQIYMYTVEDHDIMQLKTAKTTKNK